MRPTTSRLESLFEAARQSPALVLTAGRAVGLAVTFAIPIVLARLLDQTEFGTYKQLFLIYGTLYGMAQLGIAESLYYFVPRNPHWAGRHVSNALITLTLSAAVCLLSLTIASGWTAQWLANPQLQETLVPLGLFLALMVISALFEIVLVSRARHVTAAIVYAGSDIGRTLFMVLPALVVGGVRAVVWGAASFAAVRALTMLASLWRAFRVDLRPDVTLWQYQAVYALPLALAGGVELLQANLHQYFVASQFDAATFAVFAVGCLQIPLVDVLASSSANVLMVRLGETGFDRAGPLALALWHRTICRLAFVIVPLAVVLVIASRDIIVALFTDRYLASAPIFMLSILAIVPSVFCVDALLRVHDQTRFLVALNLLRLAIVAAFIGPCLSMFGLQGAVMVTLLATAFVRIAGLTHIAHLMRVSIAKALPWQRLTRITVFALIAAVPAAWIAHMSAMPRLLRLATVAIAYGSVYSLLSYRRIRRVSVGVPAPAGH